MSEQDPSEKNEYLLTEAQAKIPKNPTFCTICWTPSLALVTTSCITNLQIHFKKAPAAKYNHIFYMYQYIQMLCNSQVWKKKNLRHF